MEPLNTSSDELGVADSLGGDLDPRDTSRSLGGFAVYPNAEGWNQDIF